MRTDKKKTLLSAYLSDLTRQKYIFDRCQFLSYRKISFMVWRFIHTRTYIIHINRVNYLNTFLRLHTGKYLRLDWEKTLLLVFIANQHWSISAMNLDILKYSIIKTMVRFRSPTKLLAAQWNVFLYIQFLNEQ